MQKRGAPRIITTGFLATTSVLALLTGPAFGSCGTLIPGGGFFDVGALCPAVSNSGSITFIQITNSGAIGATLQTMHFVNAGSTFHSSIVNTGTIAPNANASAAISIQNSTLIGSIVNTGTISGSSANGILISNSIVNAGGVDPIAILNANTGVISINPTSGALTASGLVVNSPTTIGTIINAGTIDVTQGNALGNAIGISVASLASTGTITNSGQINVSAVGSGVVAGIAVGAGGRVTNTGTITATQLGGSLVEGIAFGGALTNGIGNAGNVSVQGGRNATGISVFTSMLAGGITNTGTITASSANGVNFGLDILVVGQAQLQNGLTNSGTVSATGAFGGGAEIRPGFRDPAIAATVSGGVTNSGAILGVGTADAAGLEILTTTSANIPVAGTLAGGITNSGSGIISASVSGTNPTDEALALAFVGDLFGGITNLGTIAAAGRSGNAVGIVLIGNLSGGITNAGSISSSLSAGGVAAGIELGGIGGVGSFLHGAADSIVNAAGGLIAASSPNGQAFGILVDSSITSFSGGLVNNGTISAVGQTAAVIATHVPFAGGVTNAGAILGVAAANAAGLAIVATTPSNNQITGTMAGGVTNSGIISASVSGTSPSENALALSLAGAFGSGITNLGTIAAAAGSGNAVGLVLIGNLSGGITNAGTITSSLSAGGVATGIELGGIGGVASTIHGAADDIVNAAGGVIAVSNPNAQAFGILVDSSVTLISGGIINNGTISAIGKTAADIRTLVPIAGGITNTGMLAGNAIDLSSIPSGAGSTTIVQAGGVLGNVNLSTNADTLTATGGTLIGTIQGAGSANLVQIPNGSVTLAAGSKITGVSAFTLGSGGSLVLPLTSSTLPGSFGTISAGTLTLAGSLKVMPQGGGFTFNTPLVYPDVFTATGTLTQATGFNVSATSLLFSASVLTDPNNSKALDVELVERVVNTGLTPNEFNTLVALTNLSSPAAQTPASLLVGLPLNQEKAALDQLSGENLTSIIDLLLRRPQTYVYTIEERLLDGTLFADAGIGPGIAGVPTQLASASGSFAGPSSERGGFWARGYGTQINAAPALNGTPFGDTRGGVLAGADWRFNDTWITGLAGGYSADKVVFDDGSHSSFNSYDVLAYGGWHDEALYVTAIAGASFSDIGSTRSLAVAGLGNSNGSFSGETYSAYGEGGYTMMPWDGLRLTPYLGLLYAHAHTDAFTETGGAIGPLSVSAVSGDSLVSTLAARLAMPVDVAGFGTLVPEVRAGWQHEFLDIAHNINVAFAATPAPGSPFLITGATVGRDSALVGVGVTHDLNADTRVFLDYDGLVSGGIAQHAFSAGLRMKF